MAPDAPESPGPRSFCPPSADLPLERLFGDERNTEVVVGFLSSVLELPDTDRSLDVETQLRPVAGLGERFTCYAAALLAEQPVSGHDWTGVAQVVVVVITRFCLVGTDQAYRHRHQLYTVTTAPRSAT